MRPWLGKSGGVGKRVPRARRDCGGRVFPAGTSTRMPSCLAPGNSITKMSNVQQQSNHFVSQLLLKRFACKGGRRRNSVLVFSKERASEGLREEPIDEIFQYPRIFDKDVEKIFQCIESKGADAIKKLIKCVRRRGPLNLTESDRDSLYRFLVTLIPRCMPLFRMKFQGTPYEGAMENYLIGKLGSGPAEAKRKIMSEAMNDFIQGVMDVMSLRRFPGNFCVKSFEREDLQLAIGSVPFVVIAEHDPTRRWENDTLMKITPEEVWVPEGSESVMHRLFSDLVSPRCWLSDFWFPIHRQIAIRLEAGDEDVIESGEEELARALNWETYNTSPEIVAQSGSHWADIQESGSSTWALGTTVKYLPVHFLVPISGRSFGEDQR